MKLYHGSDVAVPVPDIAHSRRRVDFGPGFYTTPIREQAVNWCRRFQRINRPAVLSAYELDEEALRVCRVLSFDSYSEEWLDFVMNCRRGMDQSDYDMVLGGVANDKVFDTVELYLGGLIDKSAALGRLRYEQPNAQCCIRSQAVLDRYLHYLGSETL